MVFQELAPTQVHKIKSRNDLESELFGSANLHSGALQNIRDNEGEAAEHGIYFDDTEYDYMQHIRDLNAGSGAAESFFVEAASTSKQGKGKAKMSLEDALRESTLQDARLENGISPAERSQLLVGDLMPSQSLKRTTYQDQQDIPDVIAGFQPDMDPRLREVLEALEDEAYVDDEEDFFGEIAKDGQEVSLDEFKKEDFGGTDMDDAGWETDETEKPTKERPAVDNILPVTQANADTTIEDAPDHDDGDWMKEFSKFKQADKAKTRLPLASEAEIQSTTMTGTSLNSSRRKKRKGAMTSSTGYSMTSSSLFRTEGQSVLDARFDKIEEEYAEDEMDMDDGTSSVITKSSVASSQAPALACTSGFDSIMDDFLGSYSMSGKKRVKKGGYQSGLEQLDEVRKGLGPARLPSVKTRIS